MGQLSMLGVGALLGSRLGSRLALREGVALIRPLLVLVSLATAIRLILHPDNPLRRLLD